MLTQPFPDEIMLSEPAMRDFIMHACVGVRIILLIAGRMFTDKTLPIGHESYKVLLYLRR